MSVPGDRPDRRDGCRKPIHAGVLVRCMAALAAWPASGLAGPVDASASGSTDADSDTPQVVIQGQIDNPRQAPALGKTGTRLEDIPASIQLIPRTTLDEQGATQLRQSIYNASGVNEGGQDSKGYFDHFLIRGLNAQIYSDGFSDGDPLGGLSHSLNGVERIEILEGPGSALLGSGPPGGTINIVHYTPSPELHYGASAQAGSFGTVGGSGYITGPTGITGLSYRLDATVAYSDGFRDLGSRDFEARPEIQWRLGQHTIDFALDLRRIRQVPDSYGLIYFNGSPITGVRDDARYSTPFAFADQDFVRASLTDAWEATQFLTVNNRLSYLYRSIGVLGNGDSTSTHVTDGAVVGRQLRAQDDLDHTLDYQLEPLWRFATGSLQHSLLTGFEYIRQSLGTRRDTADLPNIADAFDPMPPEAQVADLTFLCDPRHSCDNDQLAADYYSVYATDQIDVTEPLKIRASVRKDWFDTSLTPLISVPGRFGSAGQPLLAGVTDSRHDAPVSWSAGALYRLVPSISPYAGVSESHLANFNSENTQSGIGAPESARQYEAGIKFTLLKERLMVNTAAFSVSRNNVATLLTINGIESVVFDAQRTRGGEVSLDTRLTAAWHLLANATFQNAVITTNPQGITSVGNHPQGAPASMANLWTVYDLGAGHSSGFRVGAGVSYRDKTFSDITNVNSVPSFLIVNGLIGYAAPSWGLDINVHNMTNQRYFIAANAAGALVGEPLSVLVNLHVSR